LAAGIRKLLMEAVCDAINGVFDLGDIRGEQLIYALL
jgi:hypothetical protein